MSETKIPKDDPRLTAYALGELEGDERAAVEVALRDDPAARDAVREIRAVAERLQAALAVEEMPEEVPAPVPTRMRAATVNGHGSRQLDGEPLSDRLVRPKKSKLLEFPRLYFVIGGLAAACFAMLLALHPNAEPPAVRKASAGAATRSKEPQKVVVPVDLTMLPSAAETKPEPAPATSQPAAIVPAVTPALPTVSKPVETTAQLAQTSQPVAPPVVTSSQPASATNPPPAAPARGVDVNAVLIPKALAGELAKTNGSPVQVTQANAMPKAGSMTLADFNALQPAAQDQTFSAGKMAYANPVRVRGGAFGKMSEMYKSLERPSAFGGMPFSAGTEVSGSSDRRIYGALQFDGKLHQPGQVPAPNYYTVPFSANDETYTYRPENGFLSAHDNPLSTFSADVDTASYANVRRFIENGRLPPIDAVRIEEMVNYFSYRYAAPPAGRRPQGAATIPPAAPFAPSLEVAAAPWAPSHRLVRIGLKGREVVASERGPANLVFLVDVSGSMAEPNKLPLVKQSLHLLLKRLRSDDRVAIVTYAGTTGLLLPSTPVAKAHEIEASLDQLAAGGSTNGGMGIQLAYDVAKANFVGSGVNRVILCTDGDFNVGVTSQGDLVRLIQDKAKSGVFLTVLGFGMGNYKDATLQQLADAGNGNYGYVDTENEARKLLVEGVSSTLVPIAQDVKLQVEFNPAKVAEYRLIGYEKRHLTTEAFNDDRVDAGEVGAGHAVTALYEIVPVGAPDPELAPPPVDELRYANLVAASQTIHLKDNDVADELLTLKVRYKEPTERTVRKLEFPLKDAGKKFVNASDDFKFAAAVAAFGMVLRDSPYKGTATLPEVAKWAEDGAHDDPGGRRTEFIDLVKKAESLR